MKQYLRQQEKAAAELWREPESKSDYHPFVNDCCRELASPLKQAGGRPFMLTIRCTQKLIKELAAAGHPLAPEAEEIPVLREWYGNLFRVERRKCVLFTHAGTLFSFFVPGLTRPDFEAFGATFRQNLEALLREERMDVAPEQIAPRDAPLQIRKTKSRRILGCMNELVFQTRFRVEAAGGLAATDLAVLNHNLNQTLLGGPDYTRPANAFRELLPAL